MPFKFSKTKTNKTEPTTKVSTSKKDKVKVKRAPKIEMPDFTNINKLNKNTAIRIADEEAKHNKIPFHVVQTADGDIYVSSLDKFTKLGKRDKILYSTKKRGA